MCGVPSYNTIKNNQLMSYIPADKAHTLREFKYSGGTDSITYEYLWSPCAEFLLRFVPEWMAPNLITLSALLLLAVVNVLFMLPDEGELPNWKLLMMGVSVIMYQHLDNIDGKQARKTNSSSPLGMLFDHGSDAVTAFLLAAQVMKILQLTYAEQLLSIYMFIMSTYFCAMWSQYCVGYFKLGRVNPVDEGLPSYALGCFALMFVDKSLIKDFHWVGTYGQEAIYALGMLLGPQVLYMSKDIVKKRIAPLSEVFFMPLLYISAGAAIYCVYSCVPEMTATTFYAFFYSIMFFWSRNMINIQLYHITKQKYRVFNRGTLSFLLSCGFYACFHGALGLDAEVYFLGVCGVQALVFFEFVTRVLNEGADILQIKLFSLPAPKKQA